MSLYRQAGERGPALLAALFAVGLLIGGVAGFLIGQGAAGKPTLAEQAAAARAELGPVAAGIELVPIEYEGAVEGGEVTEPTEYEATRDAASRAADTLEASAEDMRAIDPAGYAAARKSIARLSAAINSIAPPARVENMARGASTRLAALAQP